MGFELRSIRLVFVMPKAWEYHKDSTVVLPFGELTAIMGGHCGIIRKFMYKDGRIQRGGFIEDVVCESDMKESVEIFPFFFAFWVPGKPSDG